MHQFEELQRQIEEDLGHDEHRWFDPTGYPSVALCLLDSVYSIGVRYSGVVGFLQRYSELREKQGGAAERDKPADLVESIDQVGGVDKFAEETSCRWRTSTRSGILKAEAARDLAEILNRAGLHTVEDVREQLGTVELQEASPVKSEWLSVRGQRSGLTWNYFLMLARVQGVKADRMIIRYVSRALDRHVKQEEAATLVRGVAERMDVDTIRLDHAIWRKESGREIYLAEEE